MPLSPETIEELKESRNDDVREFQALVLEETGVQLSTQDATNRSIELIALVRMLVRPYPEDEEDRVQTSSDLPS